MKKLIIIFSSVLMSILLATSAFAISYSQDFLEPGNYGGWTTSLKTFDTVNPVPVNVGDTFRIDIWVTDVPPPDLTAGLICSGFEMAYNPAQVQLLTVKAYDNFDIAPGPWDYVSGTIKIPDAFGPGSYVLTLTNFNNAIPDAGGDVILAKVCFKCLAGGSSPITVRSIQTVPVGPYDTTVGSSPPFTVYDSQMGTSTLTIRQSQFDFAFGDFDFDGDVDGTDASVFRSNYGRNRLYRPLPPDGPSPVEKTGMTFSRYTGDDGDLERGSAWPTPRFTDNGNGTVTDNLTGLIWLKDANCFGVKSWANAISDCNGLSAGSCGVTDGSSAGDWRLPNIKELQSLIDHQYWVPALPSGYPFVNVQNDLYWSSTVASGCTDNSWYLDMIAGDAGYNGDFKTYSVWPVRGGR